LFGRGIMSYEDIVSDSCQFHILYVVHNDIEFRKD